MLTAECEGPTAAMLHLVPFESELGRTTYIYGVATAPEGPLPGTLNCTYVAQKTTGGRIRLLNGELHRGAEPSDGHI